MSIENKFGFIGWCKDDKNNHDKIWGYFYRPSPSRLVRNCCVFWGRRGKTMHFKPELEIDLQSRKGKKIDNGYTEISQSQLLAIWPTFIQEAEAKLMWEVIAGKIE